VTTRLAADDAARLAELVLAAVHREYPSHILHLLGSDADVAPPRALTPAFYGSFDWHSAVHGHWALARLARLHPTAPFAPSARAALDRSLARERLDGELAYLSAPGREGFERPYGLAWLLQLAAELREWDASDAGRWRTDLRALETLVRDRFAAWLPQLLWPVRTGIHAQTAFALGLVMDWADTAHDHDLAALTRERARHWFAGDRGAPIAYEPSGVDFLSPILGEADLMRRVLDRGAYTAWLDAFLPAIDRPETTRWLTPVTSPDPSDGHFAHLDGLNLSRAWMLEGIASALDPSDARRRVLEAAAQMHARVGLAAVRGEHYAGAHWLGSFAVYLLTRRGIR
jgi:hypothetical protein